MSNPASILKAFAEDTRLRILRLVSSQEFAVTELVAILGVRQSRVSRHLAVLRNAGLVRDRREGNWIYYRLSAGDLPPFARAVWDAIRCQQGDPQFHPEDLQRLTEALEKRKARSKAYFDAVRTEWDRIRRTYIDDVLSLVVASSLLRPDAVVADLGPGTGSILESLAETAAKVIAVDHSESMLEVCRERIERKGLRNVELRLGDAEMLRHGPQQHASAPPRRAGGGRAGDGADRPAGGKGRHQRPDEARLRLDPRGDGRRVAGLHRAAGPRMADGSGPGGRSVQLRAGAVAARVGSQRETEGFHRHRHEAVGIIGR